MVLMLGCTPVAVFNSNHEIAHKPGESRFHGFACGSSCTPRAVLQPALNRGAYIPPRPLATTSGTVLLCRRVIQTPCGRMIGAFGFYHVWLYTPDVEGGMGFVGAETLDYAGLPEKKRNIFKPMQVMRHTGAINRPNVMIQPIPGVDYNAVVGRLREEAVGGYFPITNCEEWACGVLRDCRRTSPGNPTP